MRMLDAMYNILVVCVACMTISFANPINTVDSLPIVQVRLAPPTHSLPQVTAEIHAMQQRREEFEVDQFQKLKDAYDLSLHRANKQIMELINRTMFPTHHYQTFQPALRGAGKDRTSFLQTQIKDKHGAQANGEFAVKLSVLPPSPVDATIKETIQKMESNRAHAEGGMFQQACQEMEALTEIVLNELGAQILATVKHVPKSTHFLHKSYHKASQKGLAAQANVRIAASNDAFPRVSDLVQDMQTQRDSIETSERTHILEMELKLLQAENEIIKSALSAVMQHI